MQEIEEYKRQAAEAQAAAQAAAQPKSAIQRKSKSRDEDPPELPPISLEDVPPPPPPPPLPDLPAPPALPEMPSLPPLPQRKGPDLGGIKDVKLRKATTIDKSKPKMPVLGNTLTRQIKGGVALRAAPSPKPKGGRQSKLPDLNVMKPKQQNALMAKLIETMNERRNLLGDGDDSEDEWSD